MCNKNVFSWLQSLSTPSGNVGKVFHNSGATTEKALHPVANYLISDKDGIHSRGSS